eukprot:TRINITY_DN2791_c0_g1_i2.p1 TRINITY_DN2791_c0_g1~~TRINITY_DN2791_c0_g1_i2.p1  ORF type:complete len:225 (-),score=31.75 TRINITY_DN2791_c0_g1_i2:2-676(-)
MYHDAMEADDHLVWQFDPQMKHPRIKQISPFQCSLIAGVGSHAIRMTHPVPSTGIHFFAIRIEKSDKSRFDACSDLTQISIGVVNDKFDVRQTNNKWNPQNNGCSYSNVGETAWVPQGTTFSQDRTYQAIMSSGDVVGLYVDRIINKIGFFKNSMYVRSGHGQCGVDLPKNEPLYPIVLLSNNVKNIVTIVPVNPDKVLKIIQDAIGDWEQQQERERLVSQYTF